MGQGAPARPLRRPARCRRAVAEAVYAAGFGASSRAYEAAPTGLGMTPGARRARRPRRDDPLYDRRDRARLGAGRGDRARHLHDRARRRSGGARSRSAAALPGGADLVAADAELADWAERIVRFITAPGEQPDLPLDIRGTAFQARVWRALQKIPLGQTATYTEIAAALGQPKAVRAVAAGLRRQQAGAAGAVPPRGAAATATSPAIAGASSASARCSRASATRQCGEAPMSAAACRDVSAADPATDRLAGDRAGRRSTSAATRCCPACSTPAECRELAALYDRDEAFRSRVVMARHDFGRANTNTCAIRCRRWSRRCARRSIPHLAPIANRWHERLRAASRASRRRSTPISARCHAAGPAAPDAADPQIRGRATTTACTRICTANWSSRCRRRCC